MIIVPLVKPKQAQRKNSMMPYKTHDMLNHLLLVDCYLCVWWDTIRGEREIMRMAHNKAGMAVSEHGSLGAPVPNDRS